ncbi:MAG: DNA recombination protein RmuC [Deltaproteobacteria bacterium]|nr:DNA recombination protein RmuC [Deltaproteobacteria bacterium]
MELVIATIVGAALGLAAGFFAGITLGKKTGTGEAENRTKLETLLAERDRELKECLARLDQSERERVQALARLADLEARLDSERSKLADFEKQIEGKLGKLSLDALQKNSQQFLELARQNLGQTQAEAKGELEKRQQAIENIVKPVSELLEKYHAEIQKIENSRQKDYGSLSEQVQFLLTSNKELRGETSKLVDALKKPQIRGNWGEIQLRQVAELAGMIEHCNFIVQETVTTESGRLRPDMIVNLPGGKQIVVDAKAPMEAFLKAVESPTDDERNKWMLEHARQVRDHIRKLSAKSYQDQFPSAPDFIVMFIPGEGLFRAAIEHDSELIQSGITEKVITASPTTLIAMLKAVHYGWQQEKISENAQRISRLGSELYGRVRKLAEHFSKIGSGLDKATESYNEAVGSLERSFLPSARKFRELGAGTGDDIPELDPLDKTTREPTAPELAEPPSDG